MDFGIFKKRQPPTQPPPQWGIREAVIGSLPPGWIYRAVGPLKYAGRGFCYEFIAVRNRAELLSTLGYQSGAHTADAIARVLAAERRPSNITLYREIFLAPTSNSFIRVALVPVVRVPGSRIRLLFSAPVQISRAGFDTRSLIIKVLRSLVIRAQIMDDALFAGLRDPKTPGERLTRLTFQDALMGESSTVAEFYMVAIAAAYLDAVKPK